VPATADLTSTRIVDGALAVIARVGPDGLTHRLVAAEASVSLAATTRWFSSKEEIVEAAFVRAVDEGVAAIAGRRAEVAGWAPDTAPTELARSIERECTTDRERTLVGYALWIEAQRRPRLRPHAPTQPSPRGQKPAGCSASRLRRKALIAAIEVLSVASFSPNSVAF